MTAPQLSISVVNGSRLYFQMMPLNLLIAELFYNLAHSVALVASWRVVFF